VGNLSIQISVSNRLGMAYMFWGEARPAQILLRKAVELIGEDSILTTSSINPHAVICRALLASTLAHIGEFRKGADYGKEALRIAEHFDHPASVAYALLHLGWLHDLQGDLSGALTLGQRGISICRELNISFYLVSLLALVGHAQVRSGRPDEALLRLKEGLAIQEAMGYRSTMSVIVSMLAEAYLAAGQLPAASDHARRALALARECSERFEEARGLWVLGNLYAHPDHPDLEAADQAYRQSLVLATALDMRPLVAECHLGLAKLSRLAGNRHQAEEHLATATTMFRQMDMPFWLEKAAAERAALR
jgi:tetratricopeptide (TPR) repeat protein